MPVRADAPGVTRRRRHRVAPAASPWPPGTAEEPGRGRLRRTCAAARPAAVEAARHTPRTDRTRRRRGACRGFSPGVAEHARVPAHPQHLLDRRGCRVDRQSPAVAAQPLRYAHEHPDPARGQETDSGGVEDQTLTRRQQIDDRHERHLEGRDGGEIDLAADPHPTPRRTAVDDLYRHLDHRLPPTARPAERRREPTCAQLGVDAVLDPTDGARASHGTQPDRVYLTS